MLVFHSLSEIRARGLRFRGRTSGRKDRWKKYRKQRATGLLTNGFF